jgi:hypothetical protein
MGMEKQDHMVEIDNNHVQQCGKEPRINNKTCSYVGYFENEHGEQWVVFRPKNSDEVYLRGGDIGWRNVVVIGSKDVIDKVSMNMAEKTWLLSCLLALGKINIPECMKG